MVRRYELTKFIDIETGEFCIGRWAMAKIMRKYEVRFMDTRTVKRIQDGVEYWQTERLYRTEGERTELELWKKEAEAK